MSNARGNAVSNTVGNAVTNAVGNGGGNGVCNTGPDPTRPDPFSSCLVTKAGRAKSVTRDDETSQPDEPTETARPRWEFARWRHCRPCEVKWFGDPECWVCGQVAVALQYAATTSGDAYRTLPGGRR